MAFKKIVRFLSSTYFNKILVVFVIALLASFLNILSVLSSQMKTPPGYFYTGTGHYYLDYFDYLQPIGAGLRGHWLPINYVATHDRFIYLLYLPYTVLGQIAGFFHLSPVNAYWSAVFLLTTIVILLIYRIISYVLKGQKIYIKISALLIAIFSSPFYHFEKSPIGQKLIYNDFWYGPSIFLRRFGPIPHQLLVTILVLLILLTASSLIEKIRSDKLKTVIKKILIINLLLIIITPLSPISTVIPIIAIILVMSGYVFHFKGIRPYLIFLASLLILFLPVALLLKKYYEQSAIITQLRMQDIGYNKFVPLSFLFLNIGPILFFIPFGFKKLIRIKAPIVFILLLSTGLTYLLFYTRLSIFFGTHNLRLFGLANYITLGILTVLGIKTIVEFFHLNSAIFVPFFVVILLTIFTVFNLSTINVRLQGQDDTVPTVSVSYLPDDLKATFTFLNRETGHGCVLTDPDDSMGMVVPVYIDKRSCLGRSIYTPNFEEKQIQTRLLLKGELDEKKAKEFLVTNDVQYLLLTSVDAYSGVELSRYKFLKRIFVNNHSLIFKYE